MISAWPFKPYAHYRGEVGEGALSRLFEAQIRRMRPDDKRHTFYSVGRKGAPGGLAALSRLDWDAKYLKAGAARIDWLIASGTYESQFAVKETLLKQILKACVAARVRHLSCRVASSDLSGIHVLEQNGFVMVDGILTFSLDTRGWKRPKRQGGFSVRLCRESDIKQVREIGRRSYIYDRFHSDPRIAKKAADRLHAAWVENACRGSASDAVVVAEEKGRILGFVTCKIDPYSTEHLGLKIGTIVLVATAGGGRHRGVAREMTYGAIAWFRDQGCDKVEVGTQFRNIPASRLYAACGFPLVATSLSLRRWLD
ncbi:MAG: hypothetical protein A3G34_11675 [Candidatus Lindowbacteria bacterium RIFCSPLOWO2_12_FULL_62_27]|nr:MAG: hypothetical protein A3I06_02240 [Candidatus Lindowbacteria bacterium RIFCSPLOWO2_02_FULL_62_12]OGH60911.1 MAG: hypothetical protein A3G34_11675 [Candidatus Lindowbacteria bacterium RIFCSPLOWO2_12_FULL_62_27]